MPKLSYEITSSANREKIFDVFSNFENYEKIIPQHFPSVRIRSVRGDTAVVEEHMNLGNKEFVIMAKHVCKAPVLHEVFVIGGDTKGTHIREEFVKIPTGTKIIIDVDLRLPKTMRLTSVFEKSKHKQDYAKIINDMVNCA